MASKVVLVLEDYRYGQILDRAFRIQSVTNTVDYPIGDFLSEARVREITQNTWIEVKIVAPKEKK